MAGFLYYLPGRKGLPEGTLAEVGLADRLEGASLLTRTSAGPDGGSGLLVWAEPAVKPSRRQPLPAYRPEGQEWCRCAEGRYWLGWEPADPPGPDDLRRSRQVSGHWVTLADRRQWLVPVARIYPDGRTTLPEVYRRDDSGTRRREVVARYQRLSVLAGRFWEYLCAASASEEPVEAPEFSEDEMFTACVEALSVNYRLSEDEVLALGLITTSGLTDILNALVDMPVVLRVYEELKKKGALSPSEGSPTGSGVTDSCPDTGPPTATPNSTDEDSEHA